MGFRFRKTISVIPGLRINLSKSGVSTTVGVPGAHVTIGKRGPTANVGLPGSGMSYGFKLNQVKPWLVLVLAGVFLAVFFFVTHSTSDHHQEGVPKNTSRHRARPHLEETP